MTGSTRAEEFAIDDVLHIAEIPYESGGLRFRYGRVPSDDGTRWIRHGLCTAYHENGQRACEGFYEHGLETGTWRDYHDNGVLAAEGAYVAGKEHGVWRHWDREGREEKSTRFEHGEEAAE
jgi:antitoxin component YwqK of YwqJK toxin-antitoxin module